MVAERETNKYLIDSDLLIDVLHGQARAVALLDELAPYGLSVSLVTYGELFQGAYYSRDPLHALAELATLIDQLEMMPVTATVVERFAIVRGSLTRHVRDQVGDLDILIAATAAVNDLTVVTRNLRHFRQIPGIRLYELGDDWSQPAH